MTERNKLFVPLFNKIYQGVGDGKKSPIELSDTTFEAQIKIIVLFPYIFKFGNKCPRFILIANIGILERKYRGAGGLGLSVSFRGNMLNFLMSPIRQTMFTFRDLMNFNITYELIDLMSSKAIQNKGPNDISAIFRAILVFS